ncbi:MAG: hypothetical protein ACXW2I_07845 [Burkholderiales bacterium]
MTANQSIEKAEKHRFFSLDENDPDFVGPRTLCHCVARGFDLRGDRGASHYSHQIVVTRAHIANKTVANQLELGRLNKRHLRIEDQYGKLKRRNL